MSFYFIVKLLLFQEPKYFYLDFNVNHNLFSVISILSLAFFLLVLQTVIALAFLCWILINVFFILSFKKITIIQNRVFSLLLLLITASFSYQQYHREGPEENEDHWIKSQFFCLLFTFLGDFFIAVVVMT